MISVIEELCSRIIIIDEGRKIYDGSLRDLKDTYGTKRSVTMEIKQPERARGLRLHEALGVQERECCTGINLENSTLCVTFDKHRLQVPQILSAVMASVEVKDVQIQETELAEIVKEIYHHGVGGET